MPCNHQLRAKGLPRPAICRDCGNGICSRGYDAAPRARIILPDTVFLVDGGIPRIVATAEEAKELSDMVVERISQDDISGAGSGYFGEVCLNSDGDEVMVIDDEINLTKLVEWLNEVGGRN